MDKTPKKKAKQLVKKFKDIVMIDYRYDEEPIFELQKTAARILVKEIIADFKSYRVKPYLTLKQALELAKYWEDVLEEIDKL